MSADEIKIKHSTNHDGAYEIFVTSLELPYGYLTTNRNGEWLFFPGNVGLFGLSLSQLEVIMRKLDELNENAR